MSWVVATQRTGLRWVLKSCAKLLFQGVFLDNMLTKSFFLNILEPQITGLYSLGLDISVLRSTFSMSWSRLDLGEI